MLKNRGQLVATIGKITAPKSEQSPYNLYLIEESSDKKDPVKIGFKVWGNQKKRLASNLNQGWLKTGDRLLVEYYLVNGKDKTGKTRVEFAISDFMKIPRNTKQPLPKVENPREVFTPQPAKRTVSKDEYDF